MTRGRKPEESASADLSRGISEMSIDGESAMKKHRTKYKKNFNVINKLINMNV